MKTLSEINQKVWYRLIKVIFVFLFAIILLIANGLIFSGEDFKQVSLGETRISCTYGDKEEFTAIEGGLYLLYSDTFLNGAFDYKYFFEKPFNEHNINRILNKCYPQQYSSFDVFEMQKVAEVTGDNILKMRKDERPVEFISDTDMEKINKTRTAYGSDKLKYLDFSVQLFNISPVFTYYPFIKVFLLTNTIILVIFEIFRRAFYYITLGSIRPKKN